jgi:uncharacterized membrane protein
MEAIEMSEGHNLIVVTFEDDSKAYEGLSKLKQASVAGRVGVRSAAVLERDADGRLAVPEAGDAVIGTGLAAGGLIGLLVGVLGGPVGVVLGFGVGAVAGSLFDIERGEREGGVLAHVAGSIPAGRTALVAEVDEYAVEVIDGEMRALGGTVVRTPAAEVLAALEAAEKAARTAQLKLHSAELKMQRAGITTAGGMGATVGCSGDPGGAAPVPDGSEEATKSARVTYGSGRSSSATESSTIRVTWSGWARA